MEQLGHVGEGVGGEVPVLLLGQVQQRDARGAGLRVAGDDRLGALDVVGAQSRHYLSTSPITGSTEEMTATASATMPPRSRCGNVCRFTNDGPRMWSR